MHLYTEGSLDGCRAGDCSAAAESAPRFGKTAAGGRGQAAVHRLAAVGPAAARRRLAARLAGRMAGGRARQRGCIASLASSPAGGARGRGHCRAGSPPRDISARLGGLGRRAGSGRLCPAANRPGRRLGLGPGFALSRRGCGLGLDRAGRGQLVPPLAVVGGNQRLSGVAAAARRGTHGTDVGGRALVGRTTGRDGGPPGASRVAALPPGRQRQRGIGLG